METIFEFTIRRITREIPSWVLNAGFNNNYHDISNFKGVAPITLDESIRYHVFSKELLKDLNIIPTEKTHIDLSSLPRTYTDEYRHIIRIPLDLTGGRNILAVYEVRYAQNRYNRSLRSNNNLNQMQIGSADRLMKRVASSATPLNANNTGQVDLIAPNVVAIDTNGVDYTDMSLQCMLERDSSLNSITVDKYGIFAEMVISLTKGLLYNKLISTTDQVEIYGGRSVESVRSILEGYRDSWDIYKEQLTDWSITEGFGDVRTNSDYIKLLTAGISL